MDISEVSKVTKLPASTLRFYEEKGLIESVGRKGLRRIFQQDILQRLALISMGRSAGFSLDEIKIIFNKKNLEIDRSHLHVKAIQLDNQIRELTKMRNCLLHAAACNAENHFECPKFLRLLNISQKLRPKAIKKARGGTAKK